MSNTQVAIDMLHVLEKVEAQRDELLEALETARSVMIANDLNPKCMPYTFEKIDEAIAKVKEE